MELLLRWSGVVLSAFDVAATDSAEFGILSQRRLRSPCAVFLACLLPERSSSCQINVETCEGLRRGSLSMSAIFPSFSVSTNSCFALTLHRNLSDMLHVKRQIRAELAQEALVQYSSCSIIWIELWIGTIAASNTFHVSRRTQQHAMPSRVTRG